MRSGMLKRTAAIAFSCLFVATAFAQIEPRRMVRMPDIQGDRVTFCAEGDIWLGTLSSGEAHRITIHEGNEIFPKFSPDGKWIAFTGQYDGNTEVYVMPIDGGAPRRVTYDPTGATMVSWTPDGKSIVYRSSHLMPIRGQRLFKVPVSGGFPTPLPMEYAAQASFAPDGNRFAYCLNNLDNHRWKRYKGGLANDIYIGDLQRNTFQRVTTDAINEQYPVWLGSSIYYVSEKDGSANLYKLDPATARSQKLTSHTGLDVKFPSSSDGKRIIYQFGDDLFVYDPATNANTKVKLKLSTDRIHVRPHSVAGSIQGFSIGPTGKRLVIAGRSQLFSVPAEEGEIRTIAPLIGTASQEPEWSPDGKWIAFISDRDGDWNIWATPGDGSGEPKQITKYKGMMPSNIIWSRDSKSIAFTTLDQKLMSVDIESLALTQIAQSEYGIAGYSFSPDSKWIAFGMGERNNQSAIFLYNFETKQTTRITNAPTTDTSPTWGPEGKYLYFVGARNIAGEWDAKDFQMNYQNTDKLFLVTLAKSTPSPFAVKSDEEPPIGGKKADEDEEEGDEQAAPADSNAVKIDLDGIQKRLIELPIEPGSFNQVAGVRGGVLYIKEGTLMYFELADKDESEFSQGVRAYDLSTNGRKIAILHSPTNIQIGNFGMPVSPAQGRVDLAGWRVQVEPEMEWKQILHSAWRQQRDTFYDPKMHGQDWEAIRKRYEALLPAVGARFELNEIIGEMIAEMNVSHEFVGGGYSRPRGQQSSPIAAIGADFDWNIVDKAYKFTAIFEGDGYDPETRSPLMEPGLNVNVGDYLLAINGNELSRDIDPNMYLLEQAGKVITLTVNSAPTMEGARTIRIKALRSDSAQRDAHWVNKNREYTIRNGGENFAYIHLPDMGNGGVDEFVKQFFANLDKDALIVDVRHNSGGITSMMIIEKLRRAIVEYDQSRYGALNAFHPGYFAGRVAVLCNQGTSSDGEYFCTMFDWLKMGQIVGSKTWGGYAAVGGFSTIDGGSVSTVQAGSFTPDGKWLPDGTGFIPKNYVMDDTASFLAGRDPQIDKAIEILKADLLKNPIERVKRQDPPSDAKKHDPPK
ncbi:MAG: PD40 domain-containing protein [Fimbriimonadaceae bacterium]|nr:PD40 domain-containing protein [Fimbriimonadaceae bacterium]